ncbi:sensor domain-containing diguanylate cyclase [Acinetobacter ursingii]|uniref:sensor domain-containing diguanylate cyclase n=1 Tax=Acinetobacter ursingii TaxID=108980 RepID=UPI003AF8C84C
MIDCQDYQFYKTLLESTRAIPWKIDWRTKEFSYIGPQIESVLGWPQDSWKTAQDWIDRIHEEDREKTVSYCVNLSNQGTDHEADYRALTPSGDYIWIRDVVYAEIEEGETVAIIGFMFDISERKKLELELESLNQKNQQLLLLDALTGVANRKALSEQIEYEFSRSLRYQRPLSVLFIDVDFFKDYNDRYGHLQGDVCLITIAGQLRNMFSRASDFVARFGGEEFVILLPETCLQDAIQMAEKCRCQIFELNIPSRAENIFSKVTVSIGVNTLDTEKNYLDATTFLKSADELLYLAKSQGRNQVQYIQ